MTSIADPSEDRHEIKHSPRRLNAIAAKARATSYLEIGVATGATFLNVTLPRKTAVDPHFRFDWASRKSETVRFFEMRSDDWFMQRQERSVFDLIFIDGLHTYEQTLRDFFNSLTMAHARTVWLIDDTVPRDIYAAWPDQAEGVGLRYEAQGLPPRKTGAWMGDVYKVIFTLHDFLPGFSYCTITTGGNPQTLVWQQTRKDFAPLFNNLEAISRLTYFDFRRHIAVMKGKSEEEALAELFAFLG